MCQSVIAFFMAIFTAFMGYFNRIDITNDYKFKLDAAELGEEVPNFASNVNLWNMGSAFYNPQRNETSDIFEFTEYVQLMQCSGGTLDRDLFKNPEDTSVLDDYDFTRLIKNCRGILKMGAYPLLKLGGVPLKYTTDSETCTFSDNVYPPDDYGVYYNYMHALAEALVDEFGLETVQKFRFGVMTEYENGDWFMAKSGKPEDTAVEFCKLYDYTVKALQEVIGEDVYVGAHSMTVTEGLWDEALFIRHCAEGTNYATGEKGSHICYLSASFYDTRPERFTGGKTLAETIHYLRQTAEKYGLKDLHYGVDEGRVLSGNASGCESDALLSRSVGYTWQAANDARLYGQLWDAGADYFSYWSYLSEGLFVGNPTVSYHVSRLISQFAGSRKVTTETVRKGAIVKADVKTYAAYDEENNILRLFIYNFKNKLNYSRYVDAAFDISVPAFEDGEVEVTLYRIDDDCNWFDEWCEDREAYEIGDDCFSWSPDDGNIGMLKDKNAGEIYNSLTEKYAECAVLTPETFTATVKNGKMKMDVDVAANTVVVMEIGK